MLGLATGSTPIGVYRELIRLHREEGLSFADVVTFNLDEYYPMDPGSIHSYHRFMWENLFSQLDIPPENVHIPRGDVPRDEVEAECRRYEEAIRAAGGIDLQLLGIGRTGHIGFNEPGSGAESRTRLVTLDLVTRKDAAADFFGEENVPREAITMGVATILEAREILILATGEHKADDRPPGGRGRGRPRGRRHLPPAAPEYHVLPRPRRPPRRSPGWPRPGCSARWSGRRDLVVRAVVWLSHQTGKAILKLTQRDYAEHRLSSLVARYGSPGALNGEVFNALGAKIRGRSKLPRGQRIICFSPHPDDDVISMGGILHKLAVNGNEITVAYMTSGNLAVFDHDVRRHVDFMRRLARGAAHARGRRGRDLGRADRRVPGRQAAGRRGHSRGAGHQADHPGVRGGGRHPHPGAATSGPPGSSTCRSIRPARCRKDPIGPADVAIVREPAGGDSRPSSSSWPATSPTRTGPTGSARRRSSARWPSTSRPADSGRRSGSIAGAWQEWPVTEATWLVPLSQEELRLKIQAIFKHQSQKDTAPFPGPDEREFWQRVEARNKGTAAELDRLGLAEYFAMEAYVVAP